MNKNNNQKLFGKCVRLMVITEAFDLIHVVWRNLWTEKTHTWTKYWRYFEEQNKRFQEKSKSVANFNYLQWKLHKQRAGAGQFTIFTQQSWIVWIAAVTLSRRHFNSQAIDLLKQRWLLLCIHLLIWIVSA